MLRFERAPIDQPVRSLAGLRSHARLGHLAGFQGIVCRTVVRRGSGNQNHCRRKAQRRQTQYLQPHELRGSKHGSPFSGSGSGLLTGVQHAGRPMVGRGVSKVNEDSECGSGGYSHIKAEALGVPVFIRIRADPGRFSYARITGCRSRRPPLRQSGRLFSLR
jgi:hypothetical protein